MGSLETKQTAVRPLYMDKKTLILLVITVICQNPPTNGSAAVQGYVLLGIAAPLENAGCIRVVSLGVEALR